MRKLGLREHGCLSAGYAVIGVEKQDLHLGSSFLLKYDPEDSITTEHSLLTKRKEEL